MNKGRYIAIVVGVVGLLLIGVVVTQWGALVDAYYRRRIVGTWELHTAERFGEKVRLKSNERVALTFRSDGRAFPLLHVDGNLKLDDIVKKGRYFIGNGFLDLKGIDKDGSQRTTSCRIERLSDDEMLLHTTVVTDEELAADLGVPTESILRNTYRRIPTPRELEGINVSDED